jgi:hypothetical protein
MFLVLYAMRMLVIILVSLPVYVNVVPPPFFSSFLFFLSFILCFGVSGFDCLLKCDMYAYG